MSDVPAALVATRFLVVGLAAACLLFGLTWLFGWLGAPPFPGGVTAYAITFAAGYLGQHGWTFGGVHDHGHALPRYLAVQAGCGFGAGVVAHAAVHGFEAQPVVTAALVTVAASAASFVLSTLWVFPRAAPSGRAAAPKMPVALLFAVAAALVALAFQAHGGFAALANTKGDNDNLMRLAQVRDLLAGQGWFDFRQLRMGPAGGFDMHWSRLVDVPLAAIVWLTASLTGSQAIGETAAMILWPSALFVLAIWLTIHVARLVGGPSAVVPAAIVGAVTLYMTNVFSVGKIDHHNVQLILALGLAALLASPRRGIAVGLAAGGVAAAMMAIGLETLPLVAAAGLVVALDFLLGGPEADRRAAGFGLGFAAGAAILFVVSVPPARWLVAACDALSVAQLLPALVGGVGLAVLAWASPATRGKRLAGLALLGAVAAALVVAAFPQCLADPYAGLDPRLRSLWLDHVSEARPFHAVFASDPATAMAHYATSTLALALLAWRGVRIGLNRGERAIAVLLGVAFAVSLWQIRGAIFALPLAVTPLAIWVGEQRLRAETGVDPTARYKAALAWLLSFNLVWATAANAASSLADGKHADRAAAAPDCYDRADYAHLATLPDATVLAVSNLGPLILAHTAHRTLAGAYHRNETGNMLALDVWTAPLDEAQAAVVRTGAAYLAVCAGNPETRFFARRAPQGLVAALTRGDRPAWLEPVTVDPDAALALYRIRQP